ncbi:MAG TPA: polysaccharide lyase 6 family protein, partial [Candidatus Acidoferrum sp.]|nr:polysaccharide lyase 6 family protein [Candidatus Acidoferrum sp.]
MKHFLLFTLLLFTVALQAGEWPVNNSSELSSAIAQTQPGDTIVMRDGAWPNADILFAANGTVVQPITLRARTHGRVHLTGQSRLRIAGNFLSVDGLVFTNGHRTSGEVISFQENNQSVASNCRLINCSIIDYSPPDSALDTKWVGLYGFSNRIEYCHFRGKTNAGTTVVVSVDTRPDAPNYHVIARNHFGFRPPASNDGESVRIGTADVSFNQSRTTVEENLFERCNGDIEIVSSKSCENIFRRNTFFECEGALSLRHGNGSVVEANYFLGNRKLLTGGVRIVGDDHKVFNNYFADLAGTASRAPFSIMQGMVDSPLNGYFQVHRATLAFNTFVNCTNSIVIGVAGTLSGTNTTLPPVDCTIANNIVLQPAGRIIDPRLAPVNFVWQSNLLFGTALGLTNDGTLRVNPQLALAANGIWRPTTASPALGNAQSSYNFVTEDLEGQLRPVAKDIGCDQASTATPAYASLTASNVGPSFLRVAGTLIAWPRPADIMPGTPLGAIQLNASANAPGTFVYDPSAGTFLSAGTGQVLRVVFTPTDPSEFNAATQSVTINVLKRTPVIAWADPSSINYGATLGGAQLNASADVPGTFVYSPPAGTLLNASNDQTLSVTFTPSDADGHGPAAHSVLIDVRKGSPQVTWNDPTPIPQGTALSATELNATAVAAGTFVFTPPLGTVLAGGTHLLAAVFTPDDNANYNSATNSVTLDVTIGGRRVPAVTWTAPAPLLFGAPLSSLQLNATASVPGSFVYSPPI